ncbi:MAG: restriction endonuclease [Actinomycetota bacterium]
MTVLPLEQSPQLAERWHAFSKQLSKWCRVRGSIHIPDDGFTVGKPGCDYPFVQLVGYDGYEKSAYFVASWDALVGNDPNKTRAILIPSVEQFGVAAHIVNGEDWVSLEWWGELEATVACAVSVLDFLGFSPNSVAETHLRNPKIRSEKTPEMQAALAGLIDARKSVRAAGKGLRNPSMARAGLIAHSNSSSEFLGQEELAQQRLNRPAPPPEPQPYGVSHEGAEHLAAAWMRHLGALGAEVTRFSADGGIDVVSERYIAQVKNYAGTVPVEELRALHGVAVLEGKGAILLTSGSMTKDASVFADRAGIVVLRYNAIEATIEGLNHLGANAVAEGLA